MSRSLTISGENLHRSTVSEWSIQKRRTYPPENSFIYFYSFECTIVLDSSLELRPLHLHVSIAS